MRSLQKIISLTSYIVISLFFYSTVLAAGEKPPIFCSATDKDNHQWNPFEPPADTKYDWIQLSSKEWLKGELVSLYNYSLEFDSDELGVLNIDWDNVTQIRSARPLSLRIENFNNGEKPHIITGLLCLNEKKVLIYSNNKIASYTQNMVVSIAKGTDKETDLWIGKITLGANLKSGNSDVSDTNMALHARRRTATSSLLITYTGNYSRAQNVETSNNHRVNSNYDLFHSRKFFWRVYTAEYYRDTFKNIDQQVSLSTSFGYHLIRNSKTEWEISGGPGTIYKRFVSVNPGKDIDNTSPFLALGMRLDTEITKSMDYLVNYSSQIVNKITGSYTHHLITTLSSDITKNLDLNISLIWDRVENPQPDSNNTTPEKDDYQTIIGISYDF